MGELGLQQRCYKPLICQMMKAETEMTLLLQKPRGMSECMQEDIFLNHEDLDL